MYRELSLVNPMYIGPVWGQVYTVLICAGLGFRDLGCIWELPLMHPTAHVHPVSGRAGVPNGSYIGPAWGQVCAWRLRTGLSLGFISLKLRI